MTLSTLLGKDHHHPIMNEREHISFHPPWKDSGSKTKNPQTALSALTLLAFLFFLNMLQSCLRDSLQSQAPITIMMTTTTTTTETEAQRHKRSNDEVVVKEDNSNVNKENNDTKEPIQISNSKNTAVVKYNEISDYNIFILEEELTFNNTKKINKNEKARASNITEIEDSSVLSNWIYDKVCCHCKVKDKKNKRRKNSKGYLKVGISIFCEFIDAITVQGKCKNDNRCKANHSKHSTEIKDKSVLND